MIDRGLARNAEKRRGGRVHWLRQALAAGAAAVVGTALLAQPPAALPPVEAPRPMQPGAPGALPMVQPEILPAPKSAYQGPPWGVRMQRMGSDPKMLGATPKPTAEDLAEFNRYIDNVIDPRNTLDLVEGRVRIINLKAVPSRIQVADEAIAIANPLEPRQLTVLGRAVGTTVLNMWFTDANDPTKQTILSYLVRVIPDPEAKERVERAYTALAEEINRAFPDSFIRIFAVGDKLAVTGQAKDIADAANILRIIGANTQQQNNNRNRLANIPLQSQTPTYQTGDPLVPEGGTPGLESYFQEGLGNIINLIRVPGEQQVMLKVTVAEVNRAAARSIGLNYTISYPPGAVVSNNTGNVQPNIPIVLDGGNVNIALRALRTVNYARSLAEPNVIAMNGQQASFFAGGQFPVPQVGGFGGAVTGTAFVPFGVNLFFRPVITDKDRLRLTVGATVSTRDLQTGANIGGTNVAGLQARNFFSTVELREGQTLAVAGLIQNNLGADTSRIPFLGDIPILGRFFSSDNVSHGEQELVILITPELVRPLECHEVAPLPGVNVFEPGDLEFYIMGRLESRRAYDYRSPIMNDWQRMLTYRRCEEKYIFGPSGHAQEE